MANDNTYSLLGSLSFVSAVKDGSTVDKLASIKSLEVDGRGDGIAFDLSLPRLRVTFFLQQIHYYYIAN